MPTIELLAEVQALREQVAELKAEFADQPDLFAANQLLQYDIRKLKKDARKLADYIENGDGFCENDSVFEAAYRILEATKEQ